MNFLLVVSLLLGVANGLKMELIDHRKAPDAGGEWTSNGSGQEAQMADFSKYSPEKAARLRATFQRLLSGEYGGFDSNFIDGSQAYDDEQQAWRLLGTFIDCNPEAEIGEGGDCNDNEEDCGDDDDGQRFLGGSNENVDTTCNRYVLYAAYIDPNYGGGGIGEYAFWDRHSQVWDTSACEESGTDCRKMDCHLPGTEFELLGFFKESSTKDFMDQLFKHEGYCTWFPEEYEFMQAHQDVWPRGCTPLYIDDLFMDIKPMPGGDWSIGIYTDEVCTEEYQGRAYDIINSYAETNQGNSHDSGNHEHGDLLSLVSRMDEWNDNMSFWKQCNPCRTYNIGNGQDALAYDDDAYGDDAYGDDTYGDDAYAVDAYADDGYAAAGDDANGRRLKKRHSRRHLSGDGEDDPYVCNDDADYTNVNQCMKFYAKADMQVATFRNLELASAQGTIVEVDLNSGQTIGSDKAISDYFVLKASRYSEKLPLILFCVSLLVFFLGAAFFVFAWRARDSRGPSRLDHPLVESKGVIA